MKIKNLIKNAVSLTVAATATLSLQYPANADYNPQQNVYLEGFGKGLSKVGLNYGGYSNLPYCFNTSETLDGTVPIVVVCPMESGDPNGSYAVSLSDTVSSIWVSMLLDTSASQEMTGRALSKAGIVSKVFASARYDVTPSSVGDVLSDEVYRVLDGEGSSYENSEGNSCIKRVRDLNSIGKFETEACYKGQGQAQVTVWF